MKTEATLLYKHIEQKTIVWLDSSNDYLILEKTAALVLKKLSAGASLHSVVLSMAEHLALPIERILDFVLDLEKRFFPPKGVVRLTVFDNYHRIKKPAIFKFIKYYKINNLVIKCELSNETALSLIHPKFAHLEVKKQPETSFLFSVFFEDDYIFLHIDNMYVGGWNKKEYHLFEKKFSIAFIEKIHQKEKQDWLGVFYASAVSNGTHAILLLGDKSSNKSNPLAILQASGYTNLANAFVPIDMAKGEVYSFPAAIFIKKEHLATLVTRYPILAATTVYTFSNLDKAVWYLAPTATNFKAHLPCKTVVSLKYAQNAELEIHKISNLEGFRLLLPDAHIFHKKENAAAFLEWFSSLNCYQVVYSNTAEMVETISKIFKDEL